MEFGIHRKQKGVINASEFELACKFCGIDKVQKVDYYPCLACKQVVHSFCGSVASKYGNSGFHCGVCVPIPQLKGWCYKLNHKGNIMDGKRTRKRPIKYTPSRYDEAGTTKRKRTVKRGKKATVATATAATAAPAPSIEEGVLATGVESPCMPQASSTRSSSLLDGNDVMLPPQSPRSPTPPPAPALAEELRAALHGFDGPKVQRFPSPVVGGVIDLTQSPGSQPPTPPPPIRQLMSQTFIVRSPVLDLAGSRVSPRSPTPPPKDIVDREATAKRDQRHLMSETSIVSSPGTDADISGTFIPPASSTRRSSMLSETQVRPPAQVVSDNIYMVGCVPSGSDTDPANTQPCSF